MNLPNILTLVRIPMMFVIVWLMREDFVWAASGAFVLFVVAGITDWLDGYLARKMNLMSDFGALMDALTDKILMLGLMIALVENGRVHIFLVLLILGREFMITGLRLVAASKGVVMSADSTGKQKTVTQIVAVSGFLLSTAFSTDLVGAGVPYAIDIANGLELFARVCFWLCVVMTLYSGGKYLLKYGGLALEDEGESSK